MRRRETREKIYTAMRFFDSPDLDPDESIAAIKELAPRAYRANKKKSRVFKSLCDALGVTDETQGSDFQKNFAQFADELNGRKLDFKLYLSINPCHFVTMSNPKEDERGDAMTSCHSFNSIEFPYNVGCSGYARDDVTMIAFTVSAPDNPAAFHNRKTTRQLFMYKVGNGVLLQSRMYNTSGGTYGAQKDSELYRDLVQREISELEGALNLWKTYKYVGNSKCELSAGEGFGGYQDWTYPDFNAKISIRHDHNKAGDFEPFKVGTYGLCIRCGDTITSGLYCYNCEPRRTEKCAECGECCSCTYTVHDIGGETLQVCEHCLEDNYRLCHDCGEYYHIEGMTFIADSYWVCASCLEDNYCVCDECDEYCHNDELWRAINRDGDEVEICEGCRVSCYSYCDSCNEFVHDERMCTVHNRDGCEIYVCEDCRDDQFTACERCGEFYPDDVIEDGLCPNCRDE